MKNAILVSADKHWRTVMEGTLMGRGWNVVCVEGLVAGDHPDPEHVQAVVVDSASVASGSLAHWLESAASAVSVPVVVAPRLHEPEALAKALELPKSDQTVASKVAIRFWGVRGSTPSPGPDTAFYGGNTSCVELQADGEEIILDAGSGIRPLGQKIIANSGGKPLEQHLLISHTHWDHIQGLPFFIPAYIPGDHLRVVGYCAVTHGLAHALEMQMQPAYFPISMEDMPAHPEVEEVGDHFNCGSVKVEAFFTNHPGRCAGFKIETSAGIVVYASDNELNHDGQATHLPRETAQHMWDRFVQTIKGAKVLIHDAQYTREEYKTKVGWGHSCFEDVVELAGDAGVEHLVLFHHDPTRSDAAVNDIVRDARALAESKGFKMRIDAAREGMEIFL